MREASAQNQVETAQAESYWRERAASLRTEIRSLDAQINYVRARLAESPEYAGINSYKLNSYAFVTGVAPRFHPRRAGTRFPVVTGHPGFMRGNRGGVGQTAGFLAFGGGSTQGRVQFNAGVTLTTFGRRGISRRGIIAAPPLALYGAAYPNYDYSTERAELLPRLYELEAARAGLQARWRILEEEARRAGASTVGSTLKAVVSGR